MITFAFRQIILLVCGETRGCGAGKKVLQARENEEQIVELSESGD